MLGTSHQWKLTVLGKSHLWKWTVLGTSHQWNSLAKLLTFSIPFVRISICFPSNDAIKQSISGLQTYGTRAQIGTPKLSLARGILSQFLYFLSPTTISLLCTHTHTHTSDTVQSLYELPLLPNNTAVKHFYANRSGAKC